MSLALTQALKDYPHAGVTFFSSANVPPEIDVIKLAREESADGYVLGKAVAEALWFTAEKQYGFKLLVVRPVGVYGERDTFTVDGNVIPSLMVKAQEATKELTVWGSGKQERVFVYCPDLIQAVFRLLDHDARGVQYVLPPDTVTISQVASIVCDLIRPGLRIVSDTSKPEGKRSIAVLQNHPCLADFPWTSLREGLQRTYEGWKGKVQ
jgi:nucleoside-diphosphate-sugar epimerase